MYRSFILPQLDYADVIWDNCSLKLAEELESLHLDAIRTIIGAVRGTSHQKLYSESGFTTLRERRFRHKIMYHKIVQENTHIHGIQNVYMCTSFGFTDDPLPPTTPLSGLKAWE